VQELDAFPARDIFVPVRRDALDLCPMRRLSVSRIAKHHAVRVERMEVALGACISHRRRITPADASSKSNASLKSKTK
jgi:hypothetical protein